MWLKKRLVWGVFRYRRRNRDKDNETGLKEGGGIEMSNYSAFHILYLQLFLFFF